MNKKIFLITIICALISSLAVFFYAFYNKRISNNNFTVEDKVITQIYKQSPIIKIAIISDSHENYETYKLIKDYLYNINVDFIVHLGDQTNYGDVDALKTAKMNLDSFQMNYFALPGDHDIAQFSNTSNFYSLFKPIESYIFKNTKFSFIANQYNFKPYTPSELNSILNRINSSDVLFLSQPVFVNSENMFKDRYMGSLENINNVSKVNLVLLKEYNSQRNEILSKIRQTNKPIFVISGDHHLSATYTDPLNSLITYHNVGALAKDIYIGTRAISQRSVQSQRFSILNIYQNDNKLTFKVEEVIIENLIKSDINK